jgi:hypothetical protein
MPGAAAPSKTVPIAAIVAPIVVGAIVIAGIIGILIYLRRRRATKQQGKAHELPSGQGAGSGSNACYASEMAGEGKIVHEMRGSETKDGAERYRYELDDQKPLQRAELDGGGLVEKKK